MAWTHLRLKIQEFIEKIRNIHFIMWFESGLKVTYMCL